MHIHALSLTSCTYYYRTPLCVRAKNVTAECYRICIIMVAHDDGWADEKSWLRWSRIAKTSRKFVGPSPRRFQMRCEKVVRRRIRMMKRIHPHVNVFRRNMRTSLLKLQKCPWLDVEGGFKPSGACTNTKKSKILILQSLDSSGLLKNWKYHLFAFLYITSLD